MQMLRTLFCTVLAGVALSGCGTLPDARPFADATGALAASVRSSGQALADSIIETGAAVPEEEQSAYTQLAAKFQKAWAVRVQAAQGAVDYANAIADLMKAGKQGGETVKTVGESLSGLASAVNIPLAGAAFDAAEDLARFIVDRVAIVRASRSLEDALSKAQPAVDRMAEHLASESELRLKPTLEAAYKNLRSSINNRYGADAGFAQHVEARRDQLRKETLKDNGKLAQLQEFDRLRTTLAVGLNERDQALDKAAAAYKTRLQLLNALTAATRSWAAAHRDLASAVREKRSVNATELQDTVVELKDLIKKVRAL